jgi:hypothetical protein
MRIRDFAGPGGCSGVTARATDGRWVAARAALLLRVVRQLRGVEPASAVRGPAAGRARRPPRRRGRAAASARPRSLPVPLTRRRWAVVSLAFAAGRATERPRGPADAGCGGRSSFSGRDVARRARVARPHNSRGSHVPRRWSRVAFVLGRARIRANVRRRACDLTRRIERYGPGVDAPVLRGRWR